MYSVQDATIACTFASLAAESLGISSCWVGGFDEEKIAKLLEIQDFPN